LSAAWRALKAEDQQATVEVARAAKRAELGQKAAALIEEICANFKELREVSVEARYQAGLVDLSDGVVNALRIRLVKGVLKFTGELQSMQVTERFLEEFLKKSQWVY
jgi:hypothetical protein